jgi:hydrogenase maturation factor HypF (carbamoyltransferase family)
MSPPRPRPSSGRANAALLGVRDEISHAGQAAIELEQLATSAETGAYHAGIETSGRRVIRTGSIVTPPATARRPAHLAVTRILSQNFVF